MKKGIILSFVMAFALCVGARAETDYKALAVISDIQNGKDNQNQIKILRVKESLALPSGSITATEIADDSVGSAEIGTIVQTYTGATAIATTSFTPAFVGQLLIGTVSNTVHVAGTSTTNGWIQISN